MAAITVEFEDPLYAKITYLDENGLVKSKGELIRECVWRMLPTIEQERLSVIQRPLEVKA